MEAKTAQTYPQNSSQQYQAELERAIEERTQKGSLFDGFFTSKVTHCAVWSVKSLRT